LFSPLWKAIIRCARFCCTQANVMSVTGSNPMNIEIEAGKKILFQELKGPIGRICETIEFEKVPESEVWRIPAMKEVALIKYGHK
jgi:hypothetical protein